MYFCVSVCFTVVEPGKPANKRIKEKFGETVFNEDGTLNRAKLGQIVFSDEGKRKLLNSITHPKVHKSMLWSLICAFLKGEFIATVLQTTSW